VGRVSADYGWLDRSPSDGERVGLVVQAAYHLDEFVPLRDELRTHGIAADILVPLPPKKPLNRFRPGVRRFRELLGATALRLDGGANVAELTSQLSSVVVMNDWGVPRPLVESVRDRGRPTFAWIEGVQDFGDVDTGQSRRAYSHVDHVFCLGRYGADQLPDTSLTIVGSARLRALWNGPGARPEGRRATVNSNFTYGVLTRQRRSWLSSTAAACRSAEMPWVLSRHAAERGVALPYRASDQPIGDLLDGSSHFIGRFSTVCYEALVRGVEFVYHNPHGEREPTFAEARGAFVSTDSTEELAARLREPARTAAQVRATAADFLEHHLRLEPGPSPAALAATVIGESIAN
jgi:hypothetical protein